MKNFKDFILNHFDFRLYGVSIFTFIVLLAVILCLKFNLPQEYGCENGWIENIQMVVLWVIFGLCMTSKVNKGFFRFCALALTLIIIREVNCGRTLFFPIPDTYHQYYSWRDLPWKWLGKLVHALYALYIAFVGFVFLKNKFYINIWQMLKNIKIPVWNTLLLFLAMFMGAIAEKVTNNNFVFEEGFELLFYVSLLGFVWLYSRNKNFIMDNEQDS